MDNDNNKPITPEQNAWLDHLDFFDVPEDIFEGETVRDLDMSCRE